jgi:hypothetical protein
MTFAGTIWRRLHNEWHHYKATSYREEPFTCMLGKNEIHLSQFADKSSYDYSTLQRCNAVYICIFIVALQRCMLSPFKVKLVRIILKLITCSMCGIALCVGIQIKKVISVFNTTVSLLWDTVSLSNRATCFVLNWSIVRHLTTFKSTTRGARWSSG